MNCSCDSNLSDKKGVAALKSLYQVKGEGGLTFTEKLTNNLPVLGVGAGLGLLGTFIYSKISKGR